MFSASPRTSATAPGTASCSGCSRRSCTSCSGSAATRTGTSGPESPCRRRSRWRTDGPARAQRLRRPVSPCTACRRSGVSPRVVGGRESLIKTKSLRLPLPVEPCKEGTPCDSRPPRSRAGSARRPRLTLALWGAALVAVGAIIAPRAPGTLTAEYSFVGNPDSQVGRDLLAEQDGHAAQGERGRHAAVADGDGDRPGVPRGRSRAAERDRRARPRRRRLGRQPLQGRRRRR